MYKVLLIEDDATIRETTAEFLHECGYDIITAEDGLVGIQEAMDNIPDVIVCDIAMPKFDGLKVYSMLQENSHTAIIPFIFLTARTEKEDIRAGMQLGADDYITKPFDFDELNAAIKTRIIKREKMNQIITQKYSALLENPFTGIFILENFNFIYFNYKFNQIFRLGENVSTPLKLDKVFLKKDVKAVEEKIQKCLKGVQHSFKIEIQGLANDLSKNIEFFGQITHFKGIPGIIGSVAEVNGQQKNTENPSISADSDIFHQLKMLLDNQDTNPDLKIKISNLLSVFEEKSKEPINLANLTSREIEVLKLICEGQNTPQIAEQLFISERTVDSHRANLLSKTASSNTANLVMFAIKNRFIEV